MAKKNNGIKTILFLLLIGAALLVLGILSLNHPTAFITILIIALGVAAVVDGAYTLIGINKWNFTDKTRTLTLIKGGETLAIGLAAVLVSIFAADAAVTIIVYIFAVGLLFSAVVALQNATMAEKYGIPEKRSRFMIEGVIELIFAIILFCNPVETVNKMFQFLAIGFIIIGTILMVLMLVLLFSGNGKKKNEPIVGEAEVVEAEAVENKSESSDAN